VIATARTAAAVEETVGLVHAAGGSAVVAVQVKSEDKANDNLFSTRESSTAIARQRTPG
jgi:hypothetical protein